MKTYWHFCKLDSAGAPVMRDGTLIEIGKRYEIEGDPILCERGYHGSLRAIDALKYAPGPWVSKRPLEGVIRGDGKVVGRAFVQQPGVDVTDVLMEFARQCALDVVHLWDAAEVVIRYLETGDESMRAAAWTATRDAVRAAACYPPWIATRAAIREAACNAAWAVVRDVPWDAAQHSALATPREATKDAQNRRLTRMLNRELANGGDMNRRSRHNSHDMASKGVLG